MADPRSAFAPYLPTAGNLGSSQFDDSIFDKVAQRPDRRSDPGPDPDSDPDADDGYDEEPPSQREGLPPGFRMRHDAHYVDELVSRNPASSIDVAAERHAEAPPSVVRPPASIPSSLSVACAEVGQSLDAIGACLRLFPDTPRSARERIALELIEAEVTRASWLVQAVALLDDEVPVANVTVDLQPVVHRVAGALAPGWERHGSRLVVESDAGVPGARGDESLLTVAVAGMVMALQAVTDRVRGSLIAITLREEDGRVLVAVSQDAVTLPATWRRRFLDAAWTDRPGGRRVAVAIAASGRVAVAHRGTLTMTGSDSGDCRLVLSLPRG